MSRAYSIGLGGGCKTSVLFINNYGVSDLFLSLKPLINQTAPQATTGTESDTTKEFQSKPLYAVEFRLEEAITHRMVRITKSRLQILRSRISEGIFDQWVIAGGLTSGRSAAARMATLLTEAKVDADADLSNDAGWAVGRSGRFYGAGLGIYEQNHDG